MATRLLRLAIPVAAVLLATACGAGGSGSEGRASADLPVSPAPAAESRLAVLPTHTLDGTQLDTAALDGQGVVLWFWAPWCTICRAEAPDVAKVADQLAGEVTFVGVPGLGAESEMRDFVADTGVQGVTHVPDLDGEVWRAYGIVSQPAFVFISPDGTATSFTGSLGADKLLEAARTMTVDPA